MGCVSAQLPAAMNPATPLYKLIGPSDGAGGHAPPRRDDEQHPRPAVVPPAVRPDEFNPLDHEQTR